MSNFRLTTLAVWVAQVVADGCVKGVGQCQGQSSLVQVKSVHDQLSVGADEGSVAHSHQSVLLGFEKYLSNLVQKQSEGPAHDTNLTNDEEEALKTIRAFIEGMYDDFLIQHNTDKEYVKSDCHDNFFRAKDTQDNQQLTLLAGYNSANSKRQTHADCRDDEEDKKTNKTAECKIYDDYRQNEAADSPALLPNCALNLGHLADGYIKAAKGSEELKAMEVCLEEVHVWLQGLYPKYKACKRAKGDLVNTTKQCNEDQEDFEREWCTFARGHNSVCNQYYLAYTAAVTSCENVCPLVNAAVEARKADNETGVRVFCLLDVLLKTNEEKNSTLTDCLKETTDVSTDFWDIPCPTRDEMLPYKHLDAPLPQCFDVTTQVVTDVPPLPVPCSTQWINSDYSYNLDDLENIVCKEDCIVTQTSGSS